MCACVFSVSVWYVSWSLCVCVCVSPCSVPVSVLKAGQVGFFFRVGCVLLIDVTPLLLPASFSSSSFSLPLPPFSLAHHTSEGVPPHVSQELLTFRVAAEDHSGHDSSPTVTSHHITSPIGCNIIFVYSIPELIV